MACDVVHPAEVIPDADELYRRVPKDWLSLARRLHPGVFRFEDGTISVDWSNYSTALETRERATNPATTGIVGFVAGNVRSIADLEVQHTPRPDNRAHSDIIDTGVLPFGKTERERELEIRTRLHDQCNGWVIEPPPDA
jgi:hypothetical protein